MKKNTQQEQFNKLLEGLQKLEDAKWQKTWNKALPYYSSPSISFRSNGEAYKGANQVLLSAQRMIETKSNVYLSFLEAKKHGWFLKKGSKASDVAYSGWRFKNPEIQKKYDQLNKKPEQNREALQEIKKQGSPYTKTYKVFSIDQVDASLEEVKEKLGLDIKQPEKINHSEMEQKRFAHAEARLQRYFDSQGITFEETESNRAFFRPSENKIVVPSKEQFQKLEEYYSVLFHETGHSTGLALGREMEVHQRGESYAKEELVAELTSMKLQEEYHFTNNDTHTNSLKYLKGWLENAKSKEDAPQVLFDAFKEAEKATDLIMGRGQNLDQQVETVKEDQKPAQKQDSKVADQNEREESQPEKQNQKAIEITIDEQGTVHHEKNIAGLKMPTSHTFMEADEIPNLQSKLITEAVSHYGFIYDEKKNILSAPNNEFSQQFLKNLDDINNQLFKEAREKTLETHTKQEPIAPKKDELASKVIVASVGFDPQQTEKFDDAVRDKFDLKKENTSQQVVAPQKSEQQASLLPTEMLVIPQNKESLKPEYAKVMKDHDFHYNTEKQQFEAPADSKKAQKVMKIAQAEAKKLQRKALKKDSSMSM